MLGSRQETPAAAPEPAPPPQTGVGCRKCHRPPGLKSQLKQQNSLPTAPGYCKQRQRGCARLRALPQQLRSSGHSPHRACASWRGRTPGLRMRCMCTYASQIGKLPHSAEWQPDEGQNTVINMADISPHWLKSQMLNRV